MFKTTEVKRTIDEAIEAAKADNVSHQIGGFAILQAGGGYCYLPLASTTTLSDSMDTKVVGRWEKIGDDWSEQLRERAVGA